MADPVGVEAVYRRMREAAAMVGEPAVTAAAAAILWRRAPAGVEIYLGRRSRKARFLPGQWTFPGGGVKAEDAAGAGEDARRVAALVRELCEEVGLRVPADSALVDAGRWITPSFSAIRFDASFYLVEVAADAIVDHRCSGGELEDGVWIAPAEALLRWRRAEWLIPRPNLRVIEALAAGMDGAAERCRDAAARERAALRMFELVPGIWVAPVRTPTLPPATHTNCYVMGGRELVVVDPASPYDDERAELDRVIDALQAQGRRVVEIWLTHHHGDHVGGAAHLAERLGVPVAAHPATAERLAGRVNVDRLLEDGDVRELEGEPARRIRAVHTPGHAPGHLCVLEEHTGSLVAGDMVAGVGTILVEPTEGDMAEYLRSLARMKSLAPAALLPAHGSVIPDAADKLDEYVAHRLWREARVVEALRLGPAGSGELVRLAYADVPPMIHPLAEQSLIAHLIKLERDGVAAREGDAWLLVSR